MGNIRAALDIGSSKTVCIIFETSSKGKGYKILGSSVKASAAVRSGVAQDRTIVADAISSVLYEAEKQAGLTVKKAIVNVSHPACLSKILASKVNLKGRQVSAKDMRDCSDKILTHQISAHHTVLHSFPVCYDVDAQRGIHNPEYMFATGLVAYTSIVGVPKQYLNFLTKCITKSHIIPEYFVISSYASSLAMDTSSLKDFILVDIGAQTSDIVVFDSNSNVIWVGSVPLGGNNITQDIRSCFGLDFAEAEKIKILHGKLGRAKDRSSADTQERPTSTVDAAMLTQIITARVEEIMEMIMDAIPSEYRLSQFILTGGCATMTGMADFVSETFNCQAEIISHTRSSTHNSNIKNDPAFSTSLGLIQYYTMALQKKNALSIGQILKNIWESF